MTAPSPAMRPGPSYDRREIVAGLALVATAGAAVAFRPRAEPMAFGRDALTQAVPARIGPYRFAEASGLVLLPEGDVGGKTYVDVLTRTYVAPGLAPVMLLIAYGLSQGAGMAVHRPEDCYPAAGFEIGPTRQVPLSGLAGRTEQAAFLTARRDRRVEQIYFWTRIGDRFPATSLDQRLALVKENWAGRLPLGVLVRLSILGEEAPAALDQLSAFNAAFVAGLEGTGRQLLLGR